MSAIQFGPVKVSMIADLVHKETKTVLSSNLEVNATVYPEPYVFVCPQGIETRARQLAEMKLLFSVFYSFQKDEHSLHANSDQWEIRIKKFSHELVKAV